MMDERRRQELRKRYIRLCDEADRITWPPERARVWLSAKVNPRLAEIDRELNAIHIEVMAAMGTRRADDER